MGASRLVGRDMEIAQLDTALAEAAEHGSALFVAGEAGIGKTSLLEVATSNARGRGYSVLSVTGLESEADLPFAGLHQLLQPVLPSVGALPGPQKNALLTAFGTRAGEPPGTRLNSPRRYIPKRGLSRFSEDREARRRSEEHTSELQSRLHLVCRLLLA